MQGGGRKYLGYFKRHYGSQILLKSIYILRMKPKFATKMSLVTVCKRRIVVSHRLFCRDITSEEAAIPTFRSVRCPQMV